MTPEVQEHLRWLRSAVSYANAEQCRLALHGIEQEISRLQAELAAANEHEVALEADVEKGDETETRLRGQLEQAKAWRKCQTHGEINGATQWGCPDCVAQLRSELTEAKERERQLREAAETFQKSTIMGVLREKDLESANARLIRVLTELRKFSHSSSQCRYILTRGIKTCDCPKGIVDDYFKAEAALTVPPAKEKP